MRVSGGAIASASASGDDPYISDTVPVAKGCIVLGREWAGVKVYLVQKRLGTTWERDRYLQGTYDAVKTVPTQTRPSRNRTCQRAHLASPWHGSSVLHGPLHGATAGWRQPESSSTH